MLTSISDFDRTEFILTTGVLFFTRPQCLTNETMNVIILTNYPVAQSWRVLPGVKMHLRLRRSRSVQK